VADIAVQSGARLFVHFHGYDASRLLRDFAIRKAYSRLFSVATGIIAPSRYIGEKLMAAGCPSSKLHVVPCGVDINEFQPVNSDNDGDGARFIAVGRFVPKKAPQRTISAFAQIAARYPTATLDMVGEGSLLTRCKQQVEQLSLSEKVTFHGALPHKAVRSLLASSDIFVQHSVTDDSGDSEGLPVAILEGMACGLPIVSTRHSGIPEAVLDEVTGLLVPEGDVEAMAAAMSRLLDDPELIKTMGQAGRRRVVENFNSEASLMKLRDVLFGHEQ
jgi:glycosyltransferase involved in cell wall biosynthesis